MPEASLKAVPHPAKRKHDDDEPPRLYQPVDPPWVEIGAISNFTFLTGASHPEEYVQRAIELGYHGLAITDRCTIAGLVRAHTMAKQAGLPFAVGTRLVLQADDRTIDVLTYPTDRASYGRLCRLLTLGKRRAPKGECHLDVHDLLQHAEGLLAVALPPDPGDAIDERFVELLQGLRDVFADRLSLGVAMRYGPEESARLQRLADLVRHTGIPAAATNLPLQHHPARKPLQDVLVCIREHTTIDQAGLRLQPNAERSFKPADEMHRLFAASPLGVAPIHRSLAILQQASRFSLDELHYEYPHETCPPGRTPMEHLCELTWRGAEERLGEGTKARRDEGTKEVMGAEAAPDAWTTPSVPACLRASVPSPNITQIEHELQLIAELNYPSYFLTVHDLVHFARSQGILCQGRGAAANSAVCYCLGVTNVDPTQIDLLFERFISKERNEPPDIDIDFEHERREEVIQYIYRKYGRDRAALCAEVITYRGRSAVREVGKALGLSLDLVDRLAKSMDWWDIGQVKADRLRAMGLNPQDATIQRLVHLCDAILGFPRHLSQHVGGFVLTDGPLCESVPIENAAMADRTVIEWDKDDIDALGMLKVDCLGLGMMTCLSKALGLVNGGGVAKRRRDEVVERRSGERANSFEQENGNGEGEDISGSGGLAEGNGTGDAGLSGDAGNARERAVRADKSDAKGSGVGAFEHRRGIRPGESAGSAEVPANFPRLAQRTGNPVRVSGSTGDAVEQVTACRTDCRSGSRPSRPDHQSSTQEMLNASPTSSLHHFVSPSLPRSVPSCLPLALHTLPPDDPGVYAMICRADTVGVFQIESRAQMQMLPRLRPKDYYDLVIEVAIVRPGPIQGDMVHPYLRRRNGEEPIDYPDERARRVLERTLGVPLFQEQAMSLAIDCAGFTPGEADELRRAIAAWRRKHKVIREFGKRIVEGMKRNGYTEQFAEQCFKQIQGFSEYGFPESHAASFAHLVYASAYLKHHYPAAFAAALINSQPMGFYPPGQIVRDAREHGVEVRSIDVNDSGWDCSLEPRTETQRHGGTKGAGGPALRLGMRLVKGLGEADARKIERAVKQNGPFATVDGLWRSCEVSAKSLRRLASADAFNSMGLDRQHALWAVSELKDEVMPLFDGGKRQRDEETERRSSLYHFVSPSLLPLPSPPPHRQVAFDYQHTGLSIKAHPVSFVRAELDRRAITPNGELMHEDRWPHGQAVIVAGLCTVRQRPGTASGVVFMTLEDETGYCNLIVRPGVFEQYRQAASHGGVIVARGRIERNREVVHIMTHRLDSMDLPTDVHHRSRDFH